MGSRNKVTKTCDLGPTIRQIIESRRLMARSPEAVPSGNARPVNAGLRQTGATAPAFEEWSQESASCPGYERPRRVVEQELNLGEAAGGSGWEAASQIPYVPLIRLKSASPGGVWFRTLQLLRLSRERVEEAKSLMRRARSTCPCDPQTTTPEEDSHPPHSLTASDPYLQVAVPEAMLDKIGRLQRRLTEVQRLVGGGELSDPPPTSGFSSLALVRTAVPLAPCPTHPETASFQDSSKLWGGISVPQPLSRVPGVSKEGRPGVRSQNPEGLTPIRLPGDGGRCRGCGSRASRPSVEPGRSSITDVISLSSTDWMFKRLARVALRLTSSGWLESAMCGDLLASVLPCGSFQERLVMLQFLTENLEAAECELENQMMNHQFLAGKQVAKASAPSREEMKEWARGQCQQLINYVQLLQLSAGHDHMTCPRCQPQEVTQCTTSDRESGDLGGRGRKRRRPESNTGDTVQSTPDCPYVLSRSETQLETGTSVKRSLDHRQTTCGFQRRLLWIEDMLEKFAKEERVRSPVDSMQKSGACSSLCECEMADGIQPGSPFQEGIRDHYGALRSIIGSLGRIVRMGMEAGGSLSRLDSDSKDLMSSFMLESMEFLQDEGESTHFRSVCEKLLKIVSIVKRTRNLEVTDQEQELENPGVSEQELEHPGMAEQELENPGMAEQELENPGVSKRELKRARGLLQEVIPMWFVKKVEEKVDNVLHEKYSSQMGDKLRQVLQIAGRHVPSPYDDHGAEGGETQQVETFEERLIDPVHLAVPLALPEVCALSLRGNGSNSQPPHLEAFKAFITTLLTEYAVVDPRALHEVVCAAVLLAEDYGERDRQKISDMLRDYCRKQLSFLVYQTVTANHRAQQSAQPPPRASSPPPPPPPTPLLPGLAFEGPMWPPSSSSTTGLQQTTPGHWPAGWGGASGGSEL